MANNKNQAEIVQSQIERSARNLGRVKTGKPRVEDNTELIDSFNPTSEIVNWKVKHYVQSQTRCRWFNPTLSGHNRADKYGYCELNNPEWDSDTSDLSVDAARINWLRAGACSVGKFSTCSGYGEIHYYAPHPKQFRETSLDLSREVISTVRGNIVETQIEKNYTGIYTVEVRKNVPGRIKFDINTPESLTIYASGFAKYHSGNFPNTVNSYMLNITTTGWVRLDVSYHTPNPDGRLNLGGNWADSIDAWRLPRDPEVLSPYYISFTKKEAGNFGRWAYGMIQVDITEEDTAFVDIDWRATNISNQWKRETLQVDYEDLIGNTPLTVSGDWRVPHSENIEIRARAINHYGDPGRWHTISGLFTAQGNVKPGTFDGETDAIRSFNVTGGIAQFNVEVGLNPKSRVDSLILISGNATDPAGFSTSFGSTAYKNRTSITLQAVPTFNISGALCTLETGYSGTGIVGENLIVESWDLGTNIVFDQPLLSGHAAGASHEIKFYPVAKRTSDTNFSLAHTADTDVWYFNIVGRNTNGGVTDFFDDSGTWSSAQVTSTLDDLAVPRAPRPDKVEFDIKPGVGNFNITIRPNRRFVPADYVIVSGLDTIRNNSGHSGESFSSVLGSSPAAGSYYLDIDESSGFPSLGSLSEYQKYIYVVASGITDFSLTNSHTEIHTISGILNPGPLGAGTVRLGLNEPILMDHTSTNELPIAMLKIAGFSDSEKIKIDALDSRSYWFNVAARSIDGDFSPLASGISPSPTVGFLYSYDIPTSKITITSEESGINLIRNGSFEIPHYTTIVEDGHFNSNPLNWWFTTTSGSRVEVSESFPRTGSQGLEWSTVAGVEGLEHSICQDVFGLDPHSDHLLKCNINRYTSSPPSVSGITGLYWEQWNYDSGLRPGIDFAYGEFPAGASFIASGDEIRMFDRTVDLEPGYDSMVSTKIPAAGFVQNKALMIRIHIYPPEHYSSPFGIPGYIDDIKLIEVGSSNHIYDEPFSGSKFDWESIRTNTSAYTDLGDHLHIDHVVGLTTVRRHGNTAPERLTDPNSLLNATKSGHLAFPQLVAWKPAHKNGPVVNNLTNGYRLPSGRAFMVDARPVATFRDAQCTDEITDLSGNSISMYFPSGGEQIGSEWYQPSVHSISVNITVQWLDGSFASHNAVNGQYIIASGGDETIKSLIVTATSSIHNPSAGSTLDTGETFAHHKCDVKMYEIPQEFSVQDESETIGGLIDFELDSSSTSRG